ncbi:MAG: endonuclease III [Bdellovibrionales bacterium]
MTKAALVVDQLKKHYPKAHCALHHQNPLELLVATILSAQCTDERVNLVTKSLFKRCRRAQDYAEIKTSELEILIKSTGFFRAKAKSLKGMGTALVEKHGGQVPRTMEELTALPGVGRKTANVVLGNAFGIASGIVVDTHVKRLSFRLGLTKAKTPELVERDLVKKIPKEDWIQFSHWLITHGRLICKARRPACERCFLDPDCPKRGVER